MNTPQNPRVILDYDGYLADHPQIAKNLGDVIVVAYRPGASHPVYSMCDTVARIAKPHDNLQALYNEAHRAAPLSTQAIFFGKGVSMVGSNEDSVLVCVDRNIRQRQIHLC